MADKKFTKGALLNLDRDVLNKDSWTAAEHEAMRKVAVEAGAVETKAADDAVWIQSSVAYMLDRDGEFAEKGSRDAYAVSIGRSPTRIGDYLLYGRAVVRQGVDPYGEVFADLKKGASGGHRKQIREYVDRDPDQFDATEFHELLIEAIRVEKEKAEARNAKREADRKAAAKLPDPKTRVGAMQGLTGAVTAVEKFAAVFNDAERATLSALIDRLMAVVETPQEQPEAEKDKAAAA
jgi:hypothetical protein